MKGLASASLIPAEACAPDEPFTVNGLYLLDKDPNKVNLGIGVYRTEEQRPWPLPSVVSAEDASQQSRDDGRHEYLSIQGDVVFNGLARDLALCLDSASETYSEDCKRIVSVQTVSGTGANHVGAEHIARVLKPKNVWIPDVTWANHVTIWQSAGIDIKSYPYYDAESRSFDFDAMMATVSSQAAPGDVILLHACAHNPTGCDPTPQQWEHIARMCYEKQLVPFFDMAYQGFASGDPVKDAWAVQHVFRQYPDCEFLVAQSFSKNFGLYGQRAGALHIILGSAVTSNDNFKVLSNLCNLIRGEFSMAPRGGSDLVRTILSSPQSRKQWHQDLLSMSGRIKNVRHKLYDRIVALETPGSWEHITDQIGMFSYTGLTPDQVLAIRHEYHIYMLSSGRISLSGLNNKNVDYVAAAISDIVKRSVREINGHGEVHH